MNATPVSSQAEPGQPGSHRSIEYLFWTVLLVVFLGVFGFGLWSVIVQGSHGASAPLPILKATPVPEFRLTQRDGRSISQADLLGRVWLANFVFTQCTGPCPELSLRMASIHHDISHPVEDVQLVTFSLDPKADTPEILTTYANRFRADPQKWWFLTGTDESSMHRLIREGFLQTVIPAEGNSPLTHSEYFILLDRASRIRAVYDGRDPKSKPRILKDLDTLVQERTAS